MTIKTLKASEDTLPPIHLSTPQSNSQTAQAAQSYWPSELACQSVCIMSILDQHLRRRPSTIADQMGAVGLLVGSFSSLAREQLVDCVGIIPLKIAIANSTSTSKTTNKNKKDATENGNEMVEIDGSRLYVEDAEQYIRHLLDLQQRQFPYPVQVVGWYFCPSVSDQSVVESMFHQLAQMFTRHPVFAGQALSNAAWPVCAVCVSADPAQSIACAKTGLQLDAYLHSALLINNNNDQKKEEPLLDIYVHRIAVDVVPGPFFGGAADTPPVVTDAVRFLTRQVSSSEAKGLDSVPQLVAALKQAREFCLQQKSSSPALTETSDKIGQLLMSLVSSTAINADTADVEEIEKRMKEYELASGVANTIRSQMDLSQQLLLWQQQQQQHQKRNQSYQSKQ